MEARRRARSVRERLDSGSTTLRGFSLPTGGRARCAILLHARATQTSKAMPFERAFPRQELFLRQMVVAAGFLERDAAAAHRSDHRSLTTDHPSFGVRRRQAFNEPRSGRLVPRKGLRTALRRWRNWSLGRAGVRRQLIQ